MLLWAEEYEVAGASARQAVLYLHEHHAQQLEQHANESCVSLPEPLQQLMVVAVRDVTQDASFAADVYPDSPTLTAAVKQPSSTQQPRRSVRGHKPVSAY